jgi:hypothetical protein
MRIAITGATGNARVSTPRWRLGAGTPVYSSSVGAYSPATAAGRVSRTTP